MKEKKHETGVLQQPKLRVRFFAILEEFQFQLKECQPHHLEFIV